MKDWKFFAGLVVLMAVVNVLNVLFMYVTTSITGLWGGFAGNGVVLLEIAVVVLPLKMFLSSK